MTTRSAWVTPERCFLAHFAGPREARCRGSMGIALADGFCMDERNVRERQQEGGGEWKPEASRESTSRREAGSSLRTRGRPPVLQEGWPPLLTASEVAVTLRTSRQSVYATVARAQVPGVTRIGRRRPVRRDSLLLWLDERPRASPGGEIGFTLGDDSADLAAAPRERF